MSWDGGWWMVTVYYQYDCNGCYYFVKIKEKDKFEIKGEYNEIDRTDINIIILTIQPETCLPNNFMLFSD